MIETILLIALSGAADPQRAEDVYADEAAGVRYILYSDTYRQVDDDVRQIGFSVDITKAEAGPGQPISMKGVVQVKCRDRESRIILSSLTDDRGQPIEHEAATVGEPTSWKTLGSGADDTHLYRRVCDLAPETP